MSVWSDRAEPTLSDLVAHPPEHGILMTNWLSNEPHERLGFPYREYHLAVETLHDAGFVQYDHWEWEGSGGVFWINFRVTGRGKQMLGLWPLFAALGDPAHLADVLERLAEHAPNDEEEGNLRQAAVAIRRFAPRALLAISRGAIIALLKAHGL